LEKVCEHVLHVHAKGISMSHSFTERGKATETQVQILMPVALLLVLLAYDGG